MHPQKTLFADSRALEEDHQVREWLLAILRFAVTLAPCDRSVVMSLAAEMDRLGSDRSSSTFSFFTRTSAKFCDCILTTGDMEKAAELRIYFESVTDDRLRRALEGAVFEKAPKSLFARGTNRDYLWKGLPTRQPLSSGRTSLRQQSTDLD